MADYENATVTVRLKGEVTTGRLTTQKKSDQTVWTAPKDNLALVERLIATLTGHTFCKSVSREEEGQNLQLQCQTSQRVNAGEEVLVEFLADSGEVIAARPFLARGMFVNLNRGKPFFDLLLMAANLNAKEHRGND